MVAMVTAADRLGKHMLKSSRVSQGEEEDEEDKTARKKIGTIDPSHTTVVAA